MGRAGFAYAGNAMKTLVTGYKSGLGAYLHRHFNADGYGRGDAWPQGYYDTIIHCAHDNKDDHANIELTQRLLSIPCGKFIYCSSVDVLKAIRGDVASRTGAVKLECEKIIRSQSDNYLILRLGVLIGADMRPNSLVKMLRGLPMTVAPSSSFGFVTHNTVANRIEFGNGPASTVTLCGNPLTMGYLAGYYKIENPKWGDYIYTTPEVGGGVYSIEEIDKFMQNDLEKVHVKQD